MLRKCDPGSEWKNQESPLPATEVVPAIKGIILQQTRAQLCANRLGAAAMDLGSRPSGGGQEGAGQNPQGVTLGKPL